MYNIVTLELDWYSFEFSRQNSCLKFEKNSYIVTFNCIKQCVLITFGLIDWKMFTMYRLQSYSQIAIWILAPKFMCKFLKNSQDRHFQMLNIIRHGDIWLYWLKMSCLLPIYLSPQPCSDLNFRAKITWKYCWLVKTTHFN